MTRLRLDRPLVLFDLETTGTDVASDRIVEIAVLRLEPDGSRALKCRRLNPERPIPPGATAVHGIGDDDVRDAPTFRQVARSLLELIGDADVAGFNVLRFDLPLLDREFRDAGLDLEAANRRVVDAMTVFHRKEPRDLSGAVRFYLGRELDGAHGAEADIEATLEVLEAQLERYADLPQTVEQLDQWIRPVSSDAVDREGKFVWRDGDVVFGFGKHEGRRLGDVAVEAADYLEWIVGTDFPDDAREIVRQALSGKLPER